MGRGVGGGRHISAGDVSPSGVPPAVYGGVRGPAQTDAEAYGSWHGNGNGIREIQHEDYHHCRDGNSSEGSFIGRRGLPDRRDMPGPASGVAGWDGTRAGREREWGAKYDGDYRSWRGDGGAGHGRQGERWPGASDGVSREGASHAVGEAGVYGEVWEGGRGDPGGGGGGGGSRRGYEFFYARFPEYQRGTDVVSGWRRYVGGGADGRGGEGTEERNSEGQWQQQQPHENQMRGVAGVAHRGDGRSPRESIHNGGSQRLAEVVEHRYDSPFGGRGGDWREKDAGGREREGFQQGADGKLRVERVREEGNIGGRHEGHTTYMQHAHVHGKEGQGHGHGGMLEARRRLDTPAKEEDLPADQRAMEAAGYALAHRLGFRSGRDAGHGHCSEQSGPGGVARGGFRWDGDASSVPATGTDYDRREQGRRLGDGGPGGNGSASGAFSSPKHFGEGPRSSAYARREWADLGVAADAAMLAAAAARISPADGAGGGGRFSPGYHDRYVGNDRSPPLPVGPSNGGGNSGDAARAGFEGGRLPPSHGRKKDKEVDGNQDGGERRWCGGRGNGAGMSRRAPATVAEDGNFAGRKRGDGDSGGGGTAAAAKRPHESLAGGHESQAPREGRGGGGGGGGPRAGSHPETRSNGAVESAGLGKLSVSAKIEETSGGDTKGNGVYFDGRGNRRINGSVPSDGNGHRRFSGILGYEDHDETHREAAAAIASLSRAPVLGSMTSGIGVKRRREGEDVDVGSKKAPAVRGRS